MNLKLSTKGMLRKEVIIMTLQQEAYSRIDQMTDEGIKVLIDMI